MHKKCPNNRVDFVPDDVPYYDSKIIGFYDCGDKHIKKRFMNMQEAVSYTKVSAGYIRQCIDEGIKRRSWSFDLW